MNVLRIRLSLQEKREVLVAASQLAFVAADRAAQSAISCLAVLVIPGKAAFGPRLLLLGGGRGGDLSVGELLAAAQRALRAAETPDGRLSKGFICRFLRSGSLH